MREHTPGPWHLKGNSVRAEEGGRFISWVWCKDESTNESKANARLIVAAPELLEALKLLLGEEFETEESSCMSQEEKERIARKAIAKAERGAQ